ncbi:MAG: response regulator [Gammaproteobacteria bacterium]|nr:response regulator [Gammaproteobacteria bacterium]
MSDQASIICVDDEPVNLAIMEELLQEGFALRTARSGSECLAAVAEQVPDLVLLDVNMPDIDGLETCRRLRGEPTTADLPIIFISALASTEELMAGYEAGGDDYITKPFSEEILRKKIDVVLASQQRKRELQLISDQAVEALADNISVTESLAVVVRFLYQSHAARSRDELVRNVFDCLRELELDSSLLLVDEPENRIWFSDDIERPMESQILESLRGQDRVVSFGTRLALSSDHATLLVRNLPPQGERGEQLREQLSILMEGLDARLRGMAERRALDERRQLLLSLLATARENLAEIERMHQRQTRRGSEALDDLRHEFERDLPELGLSREQAASLKRMVETVTGELEAILEAGLKIDERFAEVVEALAEALSE